MKELSPDRRRSQGRCPAAAVRSSKRASRNVSDALVVGSMDVGCRLSSSAESGAHCGAPRKELSSTPVLVGHAYLVRALVFGCGERVPGGAGLRSVTVAPSVFTPEQWATISTTPLGRDYADPAEHAELEAMLRADPALLGSIRSTLTDIQSQRDSALSPMAKRWLWRVGIGLVIGLIVPSQSRN